jgi:hypothetical protein
MPHQDVSGTKKNGRNVTNTETRENGNKKSSARANLPFLVIGRTYSHVFCVRRYYCGKSDEQLGRINVFYHEAWGGK